jgi:hypothetical protein
MPSTYKLLENDALIDPVTGKKMEFLDPKGFYQKLNDATQTLHFALSVYSYVFQQMMPYRTGEEF